MSLFGSAQLAEPSFAQIHGTQPLRFPDDTHLNENFHVFQAFFHCAVYIKAAFSALIMQDTLKAFYDPWCCVKSKWFSERDEVIRKLSDEVWSSYCFVSFRGVLCRRFFRWRPRWEGSSWMNQRLWTLKTAHTIWDCQSTTCHTHSGRASSSQSIRWEGYTHTQSICIYKWCIMIQDLYLTKMEMKHGEALCEFTVSFATLTARLRVSQPLNGYCCCTSSSFHTWHDMTWCHFQQDILQKDMSGKNSSETSERSRERTVICI